MLYIRVDPPLSDFRLQHYVIVIAADDDWLAECVFPQLCVYF